MDRTKETNNLVEFLYQLRNRKIKDSSKKEQILRQICNIIPNKLGDVQVTIGFYDKNSTHFHIFVATDENIRETFEIDTFDTSDLIASLQMATVPLWSRVENLPERYKCKKIFLEKGLQELYMAPIRYKVQTVIGGLCVILSPTISKLGTEQIVHFISETSNLVSLIITSWVDQYDYQLKQEQTELIVEMSNLTLETTEIQIILNIIIPKIQKITGIKQYGVFIKEINQFKIVNKVGLSEETIEFISQPSLEISKLPYYNTVEKLIEEETADHHPEYRIILPIGSTNLMLGFLLIISDTQDVLSNTNVNFLRIAANQLFLTLQRKRLLDDIQVITQTAEFSSFPLILVDNRFDVIYLNMQSEKTFNISHGETIGENIEYALKLDADRKILLRQKINEVLTNISKISFQIDLDIFEAGKMDTRTFLVQLSPTINNLTGEYCVAMSLVDISEATKFQTIANEYNSITRMYLNVLTHDIYNIFFGISGYYELLRDTISPEQQETIKRTEHLVKRGTAIVQDIRLLSNVLESYSEKKLISVPLKMAITTVINKIQEENSEKEIMFNTDVSNEIKVLGGAYLSSLFLCAITTLLRKSKKREIEIEIKGTTKEIDSNIFYEISIFDEEGTAPSIREEGKRAFNRVFDEYVRKYLEIMIVYEIAKKYDYVISFKDVDETDWTKGTHIIITMPVAIETEKE
jgi:signal transduction histidine kinase